MINSIVCGCVSCGQAACMGPNERGYCLEYYDNENEAALRKMKGNQVDPDAELENERAARKAVRKAKRKWVLRIVECVVMTVALATAPVWIPLGFTVGVSMRVWEILTSLRERTIYGDC